MSHAGTSPREIGRHAVSTPDGRVAGLLCEPDGGGVALVICIHGSGCNGRYFDLHGRSFVEQAISSGLSVLLPDRPGHGGSAPASGAPIAAGVEAVDALLHSLRSARPELVARPTALLGHSFGGAVAIALAARTASVSALCLSGVGDRPTNAYVAAQCSPEGLVRRPYWLFGPGRSYDWRGITALRPATDRWDADEASELAFDWPARWPALTSAISCPVHIRLAEHERIWDATCEGLARMAGGFCTAARVDAAILPEGGHLYEAHLRGPELIAGQVHFIRQSIGAV